MRRNGSFQTAECFMLVRVSTIMPGDLFFRSRILLKMTLLLNIVCEVFKGEWYIIFSIYCLFIISSNTCRKRFRL